jgi:hypothetical protein
LINYLRSMKTFLPGRAVTEMVFLVRAKKTKEVTNLREVICRSRERAAAFATVSALGRRRRGQLAADPKKRVRVLDAF